MTGNQKVLFCVLLSTFLLLTASGVFFSTPTYDEHYNFKYGEKILALNPDRDDPRYDSKMPFSALNVLPWQAAKITGLDLAVTRMAIGKLSDKNLSPDIVQKIREEAATVPGRFITIAFSLLLALFVFRWTKELYGVIPALFSLSLYVLSPNIIAHSGLVTLDLYATLMITASLYYFWRFTASGGRRYFGASALALGISQLAKYTCIFLYPIFILIIAVRSLAELSMDKVSGLRTFLRPILPVSKIVVFYALISVIVVNVGFAFYHPFTPFGEYKFRSSLLRSLQTKGSFFSAVPVPLPYPFLDGIDYVKYHDETGKSYGRVYLLGHLKEAGQSFKGYFFVASLCKTPIAAQVFFLFALFLYLFNYRKFDFLKDEIFLLLPAAFFIVYFNFFFNTQIGIRYYLVIFPLCHIFCGTLVRNWDNFNLRLKWLVILLVAYQAISVFSYFPHYLSYFNELVPDRKMAYRILADSNIDWGQNKWYLKQYRARHPEMIISPKFPVSGVIVVSVNDLVGIFDPERYRWLRENFEPVGDIAYSYLIFNVSPRGLREALERHNPPRSR